MTENEKKLITMIRTSVDPVEAIVLATRIIAEFLTQRESSAEQSPADQEEHA